MSLFVSLHKNKVWVTKTNAITFSAIAVGKKLSLVSDFVVSGLLLASIKMQQVNLLASKQGNISDSITVKETCICAIVTFRAPMVRI